MEADPPVRILGASPAACELRKRVAEAARSTATVLFQGETGTGKGLAARALHALSDRRSGPFVHVDSAALSPGLVESELFGHERGAFTGAAERRPGRLERAAQGTLFLDEVGELERPLQAKWLRALQDREFERVGGVDTLPMGARVVAATHRDLRRDVDRGRFRADLYYRLAVVRVRVPPLRERAGDASLLARAALPALARRLELPEVRPDAGFFGRLDRAPWPGNVRELHNVLECVALRFAGREVGAAALDGLIESAGSPMDGAPAGRCLRAGEAGRARDPAHARAAVERCGGNVARAARELGLPRTTLRELLGRHAGREPGRAARPARRSPTAREPRGGSRST
ncbi:MAG: sigma 54-interacting transcriptional regulator [Myxococcota bacterium]